MTFCPNGSPMESRSLVRAAWLFSYLRFRSGFLLAGVTGATRSAVARSVCSESAGKPKCDTEIIWSAIWACIRSAAAGHAPPRPTQPRHPRPKARLLCDHGISRGRPGYPLDATHRLRVL